MFTTTRFGAFIAMAATISLLGAAPQQASSMYLRMSNTNAAPHVASLDYDAVVTVPARPHTPAALLPPDRVLGSMVLSTGASFRGVSAFTVVQLNNDGSVVQRTAFNGISIRSIAPVGLADGNMGRRVEFDAASVVVSVPRG